MPSGVATIEIIYSSPGKANKKQIATCVGCPGGSVTWTATPKDVVGSGVYTATITAIDAAGNKSSAIRVNVIVL